MVTIKKIRTADEAEQHLRALGADPPGIGIMSKKMLLFIFHVFGLDIRAANILKQDALSFGADVALSKEASMLKKKKSDVILIANQRQLEQLIGKLKGQPFGLRAVAENIQRDFSRYERNFGPPRIMGVLNMTPDSFSDGGKFFDTDAAIQHAKMLAADGAHIIDIGGEPTGPGSVFVPADEEMRRVLQIIERASKIKGVQISVDTYKAKVARAAIEKGATIVNDVTALRGDPDMASVIASSGARVVLMYSKDDTPRTTRLRKNYKDVMKTIKDFLEQRIEYAMKNGIAETQIIVDPGMGAFVSANPRYSFEILSRLYELKTLGFPILVGTSRKSFLGGKISDRAPATLATTMLAMQNGAQIVRVHDVRPVADLMRNLKNL